MENEEKIIHVTVKGIILNKKKFLILKRSGYSKNEASEWELPGGGIEFGESPEEALTREVLEETGIKLRIKRVLYTWALVKKETNHVVGITFLCTTKETIPSLSHEHTDFAWISRDEIDKWNLNENLLEDLKKFF